MTHPLFAPGYRNEPYWWEAVPRPALPETALPKSADVAIVGSGYTGLMTAIETARGGRATLVLDSEEAGWGCSTRNGGQVGTSLKPGFDVLTARHGKERAFAILRQGHEALAFIGEFIAREGIECGFERVGRFHAAHNRSSYDKLARSIENPVKGLESGAHMVARAEQHGELGTDAYHGGAVYPRHVSLDPALYHRGLLERALAAGATVVPRTAVTGIARDGTGFRVATARGHVGARDVVIATNGYTGTLTPWLRRRIIPIGSYIIATEPLDPALMARLMPKGRVVSDTRKLVFYYRPSPDRRRILFGGRIARNETDPRVSAPRLHAEMTGIFPDLAATRITHSWMGFVAYTFDTMPHIGTRDGLHYCLGYCGSGVSLASWFGQRLGQRVLGRAEGRTPLDDLPFPTRPLYTGHPWFLAPSIAWYRLRDRIDL